MKWERKYYLLGAGAAGNEEAMTTMIDSFRKYIMCFRAGGNQEGGYVFAYNTDKPGDVEKTSALEESYTMGKRL